MNDRARPYADATATGVALGLVLLISFVIAGRGLGASGAFADVAGRMIDGVAPGFLNSHPALADRLPSGLKLSDEWIVWEIVGVFVGAAISAKLSGRSGRSANAAQVASKFGITNSLAGGVLMGIGARLAYGCTSGLALSGGALLATGAWVFIAVAFSTAILVSLVVRTASSGAR